LQLKKHLVTASYVHKSKSDANERAKTAGVTILREMGLDPGIGMVTTCVIFLKCVFLFRCKFLIF